MKMKTFFSLLAWAGAFLLIFPAGEMPGQKSQPPKQTATYVTYCEQVLPNLKKNLQELANSKCRTMTSSVQCVERKTNTEIFATLTVHPDKIECGTVAVGETLTVDATAAKKAAPSRRPPFEVQILQNHCFNKGTTLEAVVPGFRAENGGSEFLYLWEVDGKKAGHARKVECACGKEATVRVTQARTGVSVRKNVRLNSCSSMGDK